MENLRLKRENNVLEKKNKDLLTQNHELMLKNNSLNQEILFLKYSNKESNYKQPTNNNLIIELNKTISDLKTKINQINKEKFELVKINNQLKTSNNTYQNEKQKQLKYSSGVNNNASELKKLNDILNKNIINLENEKSKNKKQIQELIEENNNINKQIYQIQKENEKLYQKITDINKTLEEYKEKNSRISKELNNERDINTFNEEKIKDLERKLEEYNINEFDDQKTKTHKINKINKVNEIEMEKLTKKFSHSPYYGKNTSTFSTNNTTNKLFFINNLEELEISPDNYTIVKQFKLSNNLKWYLLKKLKKHNSGQKEENSPSPKPVLKQQSRRFKYIKLNSKSTNNIYNDDSYSDFIWKSNKNEKDFINFNTDIIDNDQNEDSTSKQKKINELESCVKDLEEKLEKKENDCNRINLNYAKLFKRSKMPEIGYDKLLENIEKLKEENKSMKKKIENLKLNQNFIGFSFIEDDLEGSRFIDDKCFEDILDELNNNKKNSNFDMMKYFRSHEDDKEISYRENKRIKEVNSEKKYFIFRRDNNNEEKTNYVKNDDNKDNNTNTMEIKRIMNKEHINYFDKDLKSPNRTNIIKFNKNIEIDNKDNENKNMLIKKINSEKKEIVGYKKLNKIIKTDNENIVNDSKEKIQKTYRFRRTYKSSTNKKLENTSNLESNRNNFSKVDDTVNDKSKNQDFTNNKLFGNSKTFKIEDKNKIGGDIKNEIVQENAVKLNRFSRGRRFYKRKQENSKINDINEK